MYDRGLYPYTARYLPFFRNHFSTIGVNGMNEMIRNYTGDAFDITDERGINLCLEVLDHMRAKLVGYQEETGNLYNLEATPAEGTTYRFAKEDKKATLRLSKPGQERIYTTQTPRRFRSITPTILSRLWNCRTVCNANTLAEPFFICI